MNILTFFLFSCQYVSDVRTVQKIIQNIEESIVFINKEEALYQWDKTVYPELEVMKETIEPYQKLFNVVLKWQRTKKRFVESSVTENHVLLMKLITFFNIRQMIYFFCPRRSLISFCSVSLDGWMDLSWN